MNPEIKPRKPDPKTLAIKSLLTLKRSKAPEIEPMQIKKN
ncbi:hypothetical protein EV06_1650 [Prochlorococcus sp. MIT 0602]|nr:hypothetical protein EV06_1650 [Prochlorococcus sp. MIT 0602]KGG15981.1 hypothetical protein EV07_1948 [Prochlorococcus sp. MIT 0603]